jgi:hypothetical protein
MNFTTGLRIKSAASKSFIRQNCLSIMAVYFLGPAAGIAQTFMVLDLIDEYHPLIESIILGKGIQLFAQAAQKKYLVLLGQNTLHSGVAELIYRPASRDVKKDW